MSLDQQNTLGLLSILGALSIVTSCSEIEHPCEKFINEAAGQYSGAAILGLDGAVTTAPYSGCGVNFVGEFDWHLTLAEEFDDSPYEGVVRKPIEISVVGRIQPPRPDLPLTFEVSEVVGYSFNVRAEDAARVYRDRMGLPAPTLKQ